MKKLPMPSREELHREYVVEGKSAREIGKGRGVSKGTVENWTRKYGISKKVPCSSSQKDPLEELLEGYLSSHTRLEQPSGERGDEMPQNLS